MKAFLPVTLSALIVVAFSGCLEATPVGVESNEAPAIAIDDSLKIEAKDCIQGGGNSVYKGKTNVGPFPTADQLPELGNPTIGAFGAVFAPGDTSYGIWHVGTMCKTYTYMGKEYDNFQMGWIAQMIERPEFDDWGEPRIQYLVADLSFNNQEFVDATGTASGGAEISLSTNMVIEWYAPEKYMHVVIAEANHGTFDFTAEIHKEFAKKETEHIRFWMLPSADGMGGHSHGLAEDSETSMYRPISIDIFDTAHGDGVRLAGESLGTFVHLNGEEMHQGNPLGHYQDGFDRTIIIGPAPTGVTYDETWLH